MGNSAYIHAHPSETVTIEWAAEAMLDYFLRIHFSGFGSKTDTSFTLLAKSQPPSGHVTEALHYRTALDIYDALERLVKRKFRFDENQLRCMQVNYDGPTWVIRCDIGDRLLTFTCLGPVND